MAGRRSLFFSDALQRFPSQLFLLSEHTPFERAGLSVHGKDVSVMGEALQEGVRIGNKNHWQGFGRSIGMDA
jgi:hypothetical protein